MSPIVGKNVFSWKRFASSDIAGRFSGSWSILATYSCADTARLFFFVVFTEYARFECSRLSSSRGSETRIWCRDRSTCLKPYRRTSERSVVPSFSSIIRCGPRSELYLAEDLTRNIEVRVKGVPKVVEIAPHELGETPRMRHLILEYVPTVVAGLLGDLLDGSTFLGTPVVSAMVECIVDNNAYDIDLMRRIGASEVIERSRSATETRSLRSIPV